MATSNSSLVDKYRDKVCTLYPESFLTEEKIVDILNACKTEQEIKTIFYYLSLTLKSSPNKKESGNLLFKHVDISPYDLGQWIETINFFHHWLLSHNRSTSFPTMIGYISCCTESPENIILKYKLKDILEKMLDDYGFDG